LKQVEGARAHILAAEIGSHFRSSAYPAMYGAAAAALGISGHFQAINLPENSEAHLCMILDGIRHLGFAGVHVASPFKHAVVEFIDEHDGDVMHADEVDTIVVKNGRLVGHNTDFTSLTRTLAQLIKSAPGPVVLIGGTVRSKSTISAIIQAGATEVRVVSADKCLITICADILASNTNLKIVENCDMALAEAVGIYCLCGWQTCSASTALQMVKFNSDMWLIDADAGSANSSPILSKAFLAGARVLSGRDLAVDRAAASFHLLTKQQAPREAMASAFDASAGAI